MTEETKKKRGRPSKAQKASDGLQSMTNALINERSYTNYFTSSPRVSQTELRAIYKTGIGSKIVRLKAGNALKNTLQFADSQDEAYYKAKLEHLVRDAAKSMIAYGRGVLLLHERGADLMSPIDDGAKDYRVSFFSGSQDIANATSTTMDLEHPRYMLPTVYTIRGHRVHWSRVVDFTYYRPPEIEAASYGYGGISEFELIRDQLVNDAVVQRAIPMLIDKASSAVYRLEGLKALMRAKKDNEVKAYLATAETMRSLYGAILIDKEDDVTSLQQTLTNLSEADQITLRRLAMVTGISISALIGENVQGLNSSGDNERRIDQEMIEALQQDYLLRPINELMRKLGRGAVSFKENQGDTKESRLAYDAQALQNAQSLMAIGEDYETYLEEKGVIKPDANQSIWE